MKVVVTGTRGIPGIQGGVETHCEHLYPLLAQKRCDVTVMRRDAYVDQTAHLESYNGVKLCDLPTYRSKHFEAALHTLLSIFRARFMSPDVLHIHAVGPCLMAPVARMMGMKVVATHHGCDYKRDKWGSVASAIIKLGELCMVKFADHIIAVSDSIACDLEHQYGCKDKVTVIYNGVDKPVKPAGTDFIEELGLNRKEYIVAVARFVPEKRLDQLIEAYTLLNDKCGKKLVLVGDSDHDDQYSAQLKAKAREAGVVLTGFITGEKLAQVMYNAGLFVLPSVHEGLPISLLEAMSYGLDVLVSDIDACRLPELEGTDFFKADDVNSLRLRLSEKLEKSCPERYFNMTRYSWEQIARDTLKVYKM